MAALGKLLKNYYHSSLFPNECWRPGRQRPHQHHGELPAPEPIGAQLGSQSGKKEREAGVGERETERDTDIVSDRQADTEYKSYKDRPRDIHREREVETERDKD